jgi:TrmH family RNA methyltransferase
MNTILAQIKIVLVKTSHPGNIGAAARAMKNMGLSNLVLVKPKIFPAYEADRRASGAIDILEQCTVVETLDEAIKDCHFVVASSARKRQFKIDQLDLREMAHTIVTNVTEGCKVAILFGTERTGLTNEELEKAHVFLTVPCNSEYSSLNVASTVQLVAYECRMAAMQQSENKDSLAHVQVANADDLSGLIAHLEDVLIKVGYLDPKVPKKLMRRLQRFYQKARPTSEEINVWRGIFNKILKNV